MCKTAEAYVQDRMLELSEHMPAMVVGNGPNYGVAEEAALKLSETIKIPAMHHEGEEFVHGPEMQIVPGHLVFIVDDPQGSERLGSLADALSNVTAKTVLLTAHPKGRAHEVAVPQVAPLLSAIPNLVFFQTIAAMIAERLKSWNVHPYLDTVSKQMEVKAEGYEESSMRLRPKRLSVTECKRVLMPVGMGDVEDDPRKERQMKETEKSRSCISTRRAISRTARRSTRPARR